MPIGLVAGEEHQVGVLVAQVVDDGFNSADYQEGRKAFMEKRKPQFQGK